MMTRPQRMCKRCLITPCAPRSRFCETCRDEKRAERKRYETELADQLALGQLLDGSVEDYPFDAERKWTFDRAWPPYRIACEVDGGNHMARINPRTGMAFAVGRHTQSDDYRKRNAAIAAGWRVYAFTPEMIRSGEAFATLQDALVPLPFAG